MSISALPQTPWQGSFAVSEKQNFVLVPVALYDLFFIFLSGADEGTTDIENQDQLVIEAPLGIRLIELWDKKHSEVYQHWEFLQPHPPTKFTLSRTEVGGKASTLLVEDDKGNIFRTPFAYDYSDII